MFETGFKCEFPGVKKSSPGGGIVVNKGSIAERLGQSEAKEGGEFKPFGAQVVEGWQPLS